MAGCRRVGAHRRADAGGLCRHHRLRPQRIPQDADRLHPAARPRLSHHRHAVAAGGVARAHRRGQPARGRDRAEDAGHRARREHRRLLRRDLHQRAECGRDLRHARPFEKRAEDPQPVGRRDPGPAVRAPAGDPGRPDLRRCAAAGSRHRQCRRLPHDGRGSRRPRLAGACRARSTR